VARVAERVGGSRDLNRPGDPSLEQNVDRLLREAWQALEPESGGIPGDRVLGRARAELVELGPFGSLLADDSVTEIGVARYDRVAVARSGRPTSVEQGFSSELALGWAVHRLCEKAGTPLRAGEASVERRLPGGVVLQAAVGGGSGTVLVMRRPLRLHHTLEDLVRRGTVSRAIATFLQHCLAARLNLLVVGPRDGGAEALLGALALSPVEGTPVWISAQGQPPLPGMPRVDVADAPDRLDRAVRLAARVPGARLMVDLTLPGMTAAVVDAAGEGADGVVGSRAGEAVLPPTAAVSMRIS
jgi:pilus assembly protein CpaF